MKLEVRPNKESWKGMKEASGPGEAKNVGYHDFAIDFQNLYVADCRLLSFGDQGPAKGDFLDRLLHTKF